MSPVACHLWEGFGQEARQQAVLLGHGSDALPREEHGIAGSQGVAAWEGGVRGLVEWGRAIRRAGAASKASCWKAGTRRGAVKWEGVGCWKVVWCWAGAQVGFGGVPTKALLSLTSSPSLPSLLPFCLVPSISLTTDALPTHLYFVAISNWPGDASEWN
jgi:hypothetical protein